MSSPGSADRRPGALPDDQMRVLVDALEAMGPNQTSVPRSAWGSRTDVQERASRRAGDASERRESTEDRLAAWEAKRAEAQRHREDQLREAEERECTFRPVIHPPPGGELSSRQPAVPVEERLARYARASAEKRRRLVAEAEDMCAEQCTFAPDIHASPISAARNTSYTTDGADLALEASGLDSELDDDDDSGVDGVQVFEYVPVEDRTTQARLHNLLGSDWHQRDDPECTFRPIISRTAEEVYDTSRTEEGSKSVYLRLYERSIAGRPMSCSPRGRAGPAASPEGDSRGAPEDPALSSEQADELHRLRQHFGARDNDDVGSMDVFYQNVLGTSNPEPIAAAVNHGSDGGSSVVQSESDSAVRYVRFNHFIDRQNRLEARRRAAIARVRAEVDGTFTPSFCEHSRALVKRALRRGESVPGERRHRAKHEDPTFQPALSRRGASHRRRTTNDMHRDAQRSEELRQQRRALKEKADMQDVTFQPALDPPPKAYAKVESMLSQKKLGKYLKVLEARKKHREDTKRAAEQHREAAETNGCTFQPRLNPVPSYIGDMSRSSHVLRSALMTV